MGSDVAPAHAKLSPSGYHWLFCPAAPRLSAGKEDKPSKYAEEGTRAHKVLEAALLKGSLLPEDCESDEQYQAVKVAFDVVAEERAAFVEELFFSTEQRVYPTMRRKDLYGTADVIIAGILPDGRLCVCLVDLKYGKNVAVPATTPQLGIYLMGAAILVGRPVDMFRAVIVQPRLRYATREKVLRFDRDLKEMIAFDRMVHEAASKTDARDSVAIAGEHCRWCKAKDDCAAYAELHKRTNRDDTTFGFAF